MNYLTGEKIQLLDEVQLESGKRGAVVGFDKINDREYVQIRLTNEQENVGKLWASVNAIQPARTLKVTHE